MINNDMEPASELAPERVNSLQLSFAGTEWLRGFNFELNGFYNAATNLVMTRIISYENAGKNKTGGLEFMASYHTPTTVFCDEHRPAVPRFSANFDLTWTHTFKANLMGFDTGSVVGAVISGDIDANNNTPAVTSNLVLAFQATPHLRLHTHILVESRQSSYNTDLVHLIKAKRLVDLASEYIEQGNQEMAVYYGQLSLNLLENIITRQEMPARAIVNLGADYQLGRFTIGLNIHNLFNTRYFRSGMNTNLIPQQGCWFLGSIAYRL